MEIIAGLIREFPNGSFFIIVILIGAIAKMGHALINRNRPAAPECNCDCCEDEDEDED